MALTHNLTRLFTVGPVSFLFAIGTIPKIVVSTEYNKKYRVLRPPTNLPLPLGQPGSYRRLFDVQLGRRLQEPLLQLLLLGLLDLLGFLELLDLASSTKEE